MASVIVISELPTGQVLVNEELGSSIAIEESNGDTIVISEEVGIGRRGLDNYQLALANGFIGSFAAWQATLVGPIGPPGDAQVALQVFANGDISGHVVVTIFDGVATQVSNLDNDCFGTMGITIGASSDGGLITVALSGTLTEPSWDWDIGPIYATSVGGLTQTCPSEGTLVIVGKAVSNHSMVVSIQPQIVR